MRKLGKLAGFTLLETGIVLAFLILLASITVPSLLGAKVNISTEDGKKTLNALAGEESTYFLRFGTFVITDSSGELGSQVTLTTTDAATGSVSVAASTTAGADGAGPVADLGMALITSDGVCLTLRIADPNSNTPPSTGQFTISSSSLGCNGGTALGQSGVMW